MNKFEKTIKTISDYLEDERLAIVQFGEGNLLPLITKDNNGYALTIFEVEVKRPFEKATPEEQESLLADGTPLAILSFPNTKAGLNGIDVLIEWLTDLKEETGSN